MATRERRGEGGQGLIEYVLVLALIALVAVAILTAFGHQLSAFTDKVLTIVGVMGGSSVSSVRAERSDDGSGDDVIVKVTTLQQTTITIVDSQSSQSVSLSCNNTCQRTLAGVGADAGTITVTDDEGRAVSTTYPAQE
jgi:Flp pilus assembly pilin Flp